MSDNDPGILAREKERQLKGVEELQPGNWQRCHEGVVLAWNEDLASDSEAVVRV